MSIRSKRAACVLAALGTAISTAGWAMNQSPNAPPDSTASGAPSSLGHSNQPSGMAAGTGINHDTVARETDGFIQQAAEDAAAEMAAAQYAMANSQSPDVKQFASRILDAKSKANDELHDLATRLGATMPTYPTTTQLRALNALHAKTGAQFDAAYAQFMADEHTRALEQFKRAAQNSSIDPGVRKFAQNSLPMMQDNLQRANRLVASHGKRTRTG